MVSARGILKVARPSSVVEQAILDRVDLVKSAVLRVMASVICSLMSLSRAAERFSETYLHQPAGDPCSRRRGLVSGAK